MRCLLKRLIGHNSLHKAYEIHLHEHSHQIIWMCMMTPSPSTTACCVHVQSAGAFDGQPGSQLLLVGVQHVHGLYAALQALPWCEPGQPDVPLLSAPVPFLHAQLCPLRLAVS
jgi:hypothetical protein